MLRWSRFLVLLSVAGLAAAASGEWVDLMPRDPALPGWTRLPAGRATEVNPESQWKLDAKNGVLICEGDKGHEYLLLRDREFGDFVLHVEWRFTPVAPDAKYNSGVLVRMDPAGKTWVQAQTGPSGGFLFWDVKGPDGKNARTLLRDQMTENRVKPAGEWNTYEITARGGEIRLNVNGAEVNVGTGVPYLRGHVALEAEGFRIEFRNLRVKELGSTK